MSKIINNTIKSFSESDISKIREYTLKFAQNLIKNVLNNDYEQLKDLIKTSCEIRDEIETDKNIERNKEFYFGYWYAHENIGRRILEHYIVNEGINSIVIQNKDVQKLIKILIKNKAISKQDIIKHLRISLDKLDNLIYSDEIKELDLICETKIGNNIIYSLNRKGRKYYERRQL